MPSDYEKITVHNVRQLGEDTASRKTQVCMYSDSTHFVYELLQNADDYGATEVVFKLTPESLTLEHDGEAFSSENVSAITYFGKSTSRDDLVRTGRFGVGFKSVFAFSATPIIISDQEHFRVYGLYRVCEYPYPEGFSRNRTRIVLPFNHEEEQPDYVQDLMPAGEAYRKIAARLTDLNMHTLLFTRNIREIRWEIDGASGHYLREDSFQEDARHTAITDEQNLNRYMVFSRTPTWEGKSYKDVEIAFGLDEKGQLVPIQDALYVLFPTTQETHLQFIVNGPYRTNPSRETISEDDPFNCHLINETCKLISGILSRIRDSGLLTTQFLGVLPNGTDKLRPFYEPLLDILIKRFRSDPLVPTDDGGYVAAVNVFQGPSALREVITSPELAFLTRKQNPSWAKGVIQNTRADQFLRSLKISMWGYKELQEALKSKYGNSPTYFRRILDDADIQWLEKRSDGWLQKLYMLLGEALAKNECHSSTLQGCSIIRVLENKEVNHLSGPEAYFPKGRAYRDLPQVKPAILRGKTKQQNNKIEESLVALGVSQIGKEERIDTIIETYYAEDSSQVVKSLHISHMRSFIKWWKNQRMVNKFRGESIFRVVRSDTMKDPASCYLDKPLRATGLGVIYKEARQGISQKHKLWSGYRELNSVGFIDFAIACGVAADLKIEEQSCAYHPMESNLRQDYKRSGSRITGTGINQDFTIQELEDLLRLNDLQINKMVWDTVRKAEPEVLEAKFRPNQRYSTQHEKSSLVIILSAMSWIPDKRGSLQKPADITRESLSPSFRYDDRNGWLTAIGIAEKARKATAEYRQKQEHAKALGLDMEMVDLISDLPPEEQAESIAQFTALLKRRARANARVLRKQLDSVPFHQALSAAFKQGTQGKTGSTNSLSKSSQNPERRQDRLEKEVSEDIQSDPSPETRFTFGICKKWKGKNDVVRQKLLHWYGGQCQICSKTFLQRNGEPYFEGLYLVPYTKAEWIDRPGNVLCLCPWHSAMFQFGSKQMSTDVNAVVSAFVPRASGGNSRAAIDLTLCGALENIDFHEDHFLELKVMIQESQIAEKTV